VKFFLIKVERGRGGLAQFVTSQHHCARSLQDFAPQPPRSAVLL
jgi:hypothetical protein